MALDRQVVSTALSGLDTKTDDRWLAPGDVELLQNIICDTPKKWRKRNGYAQIGSVTSGSFLAPYKQQLLVGTGTSAYSASSANGIVSVGALPAVGVSVRRLPAGRSSTYTASSDWPDASVSAGGMTCVAGQASGGSQYTVYDTATGVVLGSQYLVMAGAVKVAVVGNYFVVVSGTLNTYATIPFATPNTPTIYYPSVSSVAIDLVSTGTNLYIITNSGGSIRIYTLSSTLTWSGPLVVATGISGAGPVSVWLDSSGNGWAAWMNAGYGYCSCYSNGFGGSSVFTATALGGVGVNAHITGAWRSTGASGSSVIFADSANGINPFVQYVVVGPTGIVTTGLTNLSRSVGLASKAFTYPVVNGSTYVLTTYPSVTTVSGGIYSLPQPTYFLMRLDLTGGVVVAAKLAYGSGCGLITGNYGMLSEASSISAGTYNIPYLTVALNAYTNGAFSPVYGVALATFTFGEPQTACAVGDDLHMSGGVLWNYDGLDVVEDCFHLYPDGVTCYGVGSGGFSGTYQVCATYEQLDAQGILHTSAPSLPLTVNVTNAQNFSYSVASLRITARSGDISVALWRTINGGTVFYRVTGGNTLLNNTSTNTITYMEGASDSQLQANQQLVSNPLNPTAELPAIAPSAVAAVWRYKNRVCLIQSETPYQWQFSKEYVTGVPIEFEPSALYQTVGQDLGPLTCGIQMDGYNVLFAQNGIYWVSGNGPAANGTGSDYGDAPQALPTDVGCVNPQSLVLTPGGVMFQANNGKGLYLLDRGLSLSYIGAPVEAWNSYTVTGAVMSPNARRVIFTTTAGVALVYDFYISKWCVWTNHSAVGLAAFNGLLTYLTAAGAVEVETPGTYVDPGSSPILIGFKTGKISFDSINGVQRVWQLMLRGDWLSEHQINYSVFFNDSATAGQTGAIDTGTVYSTLGVFEWVIKLAVERCTSVQLQFQEQQSGTTGQGLAISALSFLAGVMKGLRKLPATQNI